MQNSYPKLKKARPVPKGRIIALSIIVILAIAITGGIWYWNTHKKDIIKNKLEAVVREKSDGLYNIEYDSLEMDELNGYLSVSNINLSYDSTRYMELKKIGKKHSILLNINIPEISISGVKTPRALIEKEIVGRKLEIKNPVVNIFYTNKGEDTSHSVPAKEIYEQLLGNLHLIKADTVLISGAQITTLNLRTKNTSMQIQDASIVLVDVKVDSSSNADTSRMLFARESGFTCGKLAWSSENKLYNYQAENISLSSASRNLHIKSFRIIPALNEEAFVKALPTQDDRFDFTVSNIKLQNINLPQLLEQNIEADSMLVPAASFKIYRDLIIPRDKKNRVGTYPHQMIQTIPVTFRVKKIVVTNGFIEYKERNHISRQAGKVQFYKVHVSISNFTNDKKIIALNNVMKVDMSSSFLNKTPVKAAWLFYLLHPKGRFDLKGSIGAIDGPLLNILTEPMGPASIKKGKFNGLEFNLQGSDYAADGTVQLLYQDLKVALLEKDKDATQLDKKALTSFVANIIIKNDNPKKNDAVRIAQVHLDRDINRSIYFLSWKTIFRGMSETVGLTK